MTADEIDLEALRERAERDEQPYSVVEVEHTVGSPPDPDFDSSPDVAVDGSIASEGDAVVVHGESQERDREKLSISRTAVLIVLLVLALILIGVLVSN